ncbi:hypothetical protein ACLB2K_010118 [Fragaria x ananassa]
MFRIREVKQQPRNCHKIRTTRHIQWERHMHYYDVLPPIAWVGKEMGSTRDMHHIFANGVGNDPREDRYFSIPKQNYDPEGEYVAYWLPQLKSLTKENRHFPGMTYIKQVVPLKFGNAVLLCSKWVTPKLFLLYMAPERRSTEISLVIRQTMEECILTNLMPRSQIDIFVQVLQADGDAGIPMRDLVTSCSAGYLNNTPLLGLNYIEDSAGGADVTLGIMPKLDKMDAKLSLDTFENVKQLAIEGCKAVADYIREAGYCVDGGWK